MSRRRAPGPSAPSSSRGSRARRPSGPVGGQKNLIGGTLFDQGPGRLVEHLEQLSGALAGLQSRPPQRRYARRGFRPLHDPQQPPGRAQADPLGLSDGSELVLLVGGNLDRALQSILEGLDLGLPRGELLLEFVMRAWAAAPSTASATC